MDTFAVKIHILKARIRRLPRSARNRFKGLLRQVEQEHAALGLMAVSALSVPAAFAARAIDQLTKATEVLDQDLSRGFREVAHAAERP